MKNRLLLVGATEPVGELGKRVRGTAAMDGTAGETA